MRLPASVLFLENYHGFHFETPKPIYIHNTSNDKLDNQDEDELSWQRFERCSVISWGEQSQLQKYALLYGTNTYEKG